MRTDIKVLVTLLTIMVFGLLTSGCVVMRASQIGIYSKKVDAWELYIEAIDELEFTRKRDRFNGYKVFTDKELHDKYKP